MAEAQYTAADERNDNSGREWSPATASSARDLISAIASTASGTEAGKHPNTYKGGFDAGCDWAAAVAQKALLVMPEGETPSAGQPDGYVAAFYELAEMMGLPAMAKPPAEVWRSLMLPAIAKAFARALRHHDGRTGTFVAIEDDGRFRVQSLKGKGFWIFHPADCDWLPSPCVPGVETAAGWIVGNGDGTRWRSWEQGNPVWTDDREKATRYARRVDAEAVHAEDEDAWFVRPFIPADADGEDAEACGICAVAFVEGDECLTDVDLGAVHAACCGPERESYVNLETLEPIGPNDPIPTPWKWTAS